MDNESRAHDCPINVRFGDSDQPEWIHYMRTRGNEKINFATDGPVPSITRCLGEAEALAVSAEVLDLDLYNTTQSFFFDRMAAA